MLKLVTPQAENLNIILQHVVRFFAMIIHDFLAPFHDIAAQCAEDILKPVAAIIVVRN